MVLIFLSLFVDHVIDICLDMAVNLEVDLGSQSLMSILQSIVVIDLGVNTKMALEACTGHFG